MKCYNNNTFKTARKKNLEDKSLISVVIPVYNEEENLFVLIQNLLSMLKEIQNYEILFINDGSSDNSRPILENFCEENKNIKLINLSRNFGHQKALTAGLEFAQGDAVILMDADLQDPPELIPEFIKKWREGYDVVYAVRNRRQENIFKKSAYFFFYRFLNKISDIQIPLDSGDFSLMDKKIVKLINSLKEKSRFIRGLRAWAGFKQVGIKHDRPSRHAGKPKYTFGKLILLGLDGIISSSYKPLTLAVHFGLTVTILAFIGIIFIISYKLFTNYDIPGYASLMSVILFIGGIQIFITGILGEYIGRIYNETKNRPHFIVETTKNID